MSSKHVKEIVGRLKQAMGVTQQQQVAWELGCNPTHLNRCIRKGLPPFKYITDWCARADVSQDWIINGIENLKGGDAQVTIGVDPHLSNYQAMLAEQLKLPQDKQNQELIKWLMKKIDHREMLVADGQAPETGHSLPRVAKPGR